MNAKQKSIRRRAIRRVKRNPQRRFRGSGYSTKMRRVIKRAGRKLYGKTFAGPRMKTAIGSTRDQFRTAARVAKLRKNPKRRAPAYSEVKAIVSTMAGKSLASFADQKEAISWAKKYAARHRCKLRVVDPR